MDAQGGTTKRMYTKIGYSRTSNEEDEHRIQCTRRNYEEEKHSEMESAQRQEASENPSAGNHNVGLSLRKVEAAVRSDPEEVKGQPNNGSTGEVNVWLLNIRGITKIKIVQLLNSLREYKNNIICITETHEKYEKVDIPERYKRIVKRRDVDDKKGGGLMVLVDQGLDVEENEGKVENQDLLHVHIKVEQSVNFALMLIYMDTKDQTRNVKLQHCIDKAIEEEESRKSLVLGDFNGHLGYIGRQKQDKNGKYVESLIENNNFILLNGDERCIGEVTREENGNKSTIDFMLVNRILYNDFVKLEIDENKTWFDLSDHCLMRARFITKNNISMNKKPSPEKVQYYSVKEELKNEYLSELKNRLQREPKTDMNMDKFNEVVKTSMNEKLKKTVIRKYNSSGITNPVWFTREMEQGIKLRQHLSRMTRNARDEQERQHFMDLYREQKRKVQIMVRDGISQYERRITEEVRDNACNLWKNICKLRGEKMEIKETHIYDRDGVKLDDRDAVEDIREYWQGIYHKHENKVSEEWSEIKQEEYNESISRGVVRAEFDCLVPRHLREAYDFVERVTGGGRGPPNHDHRTNEQSVEYMEIPVELIEHYEMVAKNDLRKDPIHKMELDKFTELEVMKELKRLKKGKTPGPDEVKPEVYKWIGEDRYCIESLTQSFNRVMESGTPPSKWKKSSTVLIPQKRKPTGKELRPLAMTDISYKIFMSLIKEKLISHLEKNGSLSEYQAGFTRDRRIEDNIIILKYCIGESYRNGKPLYVAAIDFAKAFDSIKRESIVKALQKYKCHPKIITVLAELYTEDSTTLMMNGRQVGEVEVRSGIRQGCTLSPLLFILVVNYIIDEMVELRDGFKNEKMFIPVLFFADDGLLISQNEYELGRMIGRLVEAAEKVGLMVNKEKSSVIIFNLEKKPKLIRGIEVTDKIKYLGVTVNNSRDCFREHKMKTLEKAKRLANMTYSVIARSCNKLLIGKTYWKGVVLPSLLYGAPVIDWNEGEMEKLQRVENSVWRSILNGPGYTPNAVLRGEIGASSMKSRIIKSKLSYVNWTTKTRNGLLTCVMEDIIEKGKDSLARQMRSALEQMTGNPQAIERIGSMNKAEIDRMVRMADKERWRRELEEKSTVKMYYDCKEDIREELFYDNTEGSTLLFRARSNTLRLGWRGRFSNASVTCGLCGGEEEETLKHFIVECRSLQETREKYKMSGKTIEEVLLFRGGCDVQDTKSFLVEAWRRRKRRGLGAAAV